MSSNGKEKKDNHHFGKRNEGVKKGGIPNNKRFGGNGGVLHKGTLSRGNSSLGMISELDIIEYTGRRNPILYDSLKKNLEKYVTKNYGFECGHLFRTNELYEFPPLAVVPVEELEGNPVLKIKIEEQYKSRAKDEIIFEKNNKIIYTILKGQCTTSMIHRIMQSPNYEEYDADLNVRELWKRISELLLTTAGDNQHEKKLAIIAKSQFEKIRQFSNEPISDFYERFKVEVQSLKATGIDIGDEKDISMTFLHKLDQSRYASLNAQLDNQMSFGKDEYPENLSDALMLAQNWKVVVPKFDPSNNTVGIAFYTAEQKLNKIKKINHNSANNKQNSPYQQQNKKQQQNNNNAQRNKNNNEIVEKSSSVKKFPCWICGEVGHFKANCPRLKKVIEEEEEINCVFDVLATSRQSLSNKDILLDNQATISVFNNKALLKDIQPIKYPIFINGIGGNKIEINHKGVYDWFGEVYYSPDVTANILCFHDVATNFQVDYDNDQNLFKVYISSESNPKLFVAKNKLYKLSSDQDRNYVNLTQTDQLILSNAQVQNANKVRKYLELLAFPSKNALKDAINSGSFLNCEITSKDVDYYFDLNGDSIEQLKGKSTSKKPAIVNSDEVIFKRIVTKQEVTINLDIMYISNNYLYLVSVTESIGLVMGTTIKGNKKTNANLKLSIDEIINKHNIAGFKIVCIKCDNEGGIVSLNNYLNSLNIKLNIVPREQHIPLIERKIRQIKEIMRTIISGLEYRLPKTLLDYLVFYAIKCINALPTKHNNINISPYELFTGRKIDFKRDFRIKFGQFVQLFNDNSLKKNDVFTPRTIDAISLITNDNIQGSVLFYVIESSKIVARDRWKEIEINKEIIEKINKISNTTGIGKHNNIDISINNMSNISDEDEKIGIIKDYNNLINNQEENYRLLPSNNIFIQPNYNSNNNILLENEIINAENNTEMQIINEADNQKQISSEEEINQFNHTDDSNINSIILPTNNINTNIINNDIQESISKVYDSNDLNSNLHMDSSNDQITSANQSQIFEASTFSNDINHIFSEKLKSTVSKIQNETAKNETAKIISKNKNLILSNDNKIPKSVSKKILKSVAKNYNLRKSEEDNTEFIALTIQQQVHQSGIKGLKAVVKELKQLNDKEVFEPVILDNILKNENVKKNSILNIKTFLKVKKDKSVKARAVAGGHRQNKLVYDVIKELNSNTIKHESILILLALSIAQKRSIVTADIVGAYLNAEMKNNIYVKFDTYESEILCQMYNDLRKFLNENDHCIYVRLKKALYGCVESAKLFYLHLKKILLSYGFISNPYDECIFNYIDDQNNVITVGSHVDDLLVTATNNKSLEKFLEYIKKSFFDVKIHHGLEHQYLGINLLIRENLIELNMKNDIKKIANDLKINNPSKIPGNNEFFRNSNSDFLNDENRNIFHTNTAKLLYIARMCRPDILGYVSYLSSRVNNPTLNDMFKLKKLIAYLLYTIDTVYCIADNIFNKQNSIDINCYIDSSHGIHEDLRGQTGIVIKLGESTIFSRSAKQKVNTKSSTETELHGVAEEISQALWTKYILESLNFKVNNINLYLDNKSTIVMLLTGKSIGRNTRHINMRTFFVKQFLDDNTIKIIYMPTNLLFVDLLTKPIQGNKLIEFTNKILYK